jgi:ADP-ribosylglycohydrolase
MHNNFKATILGLAYADALGAGYEFFKGKIGEDEEIEFIELPKITAHKKYEWTDDTAMAFLTLQAMKREILNKDFRGLEVDYELLSQLFIDWYKGAPDKGIHTYNVLSQTEAVKKANPEEEGVMARVAKEITDANPMTAGNGGLMRIAAGVFLLKNTSMTDDLTIMKTASELNNLTHPHFDSESCSRLFLFLLNAIIKENNDAYSKGVRTKNEFDRFIRHWLKELEAGKLGESIIKALTDDLNTLNPNKYVITTLCLAIGAIYQRWEDGISPKDHYINTVHKCIRVGDDTDTTSAVAGAMVGAIYGEECLPDDVDKIFGYAGEKYSHVTYEDMVKTIDELL